MIDPNPYDVADEIYLPEARKVKDKRWMPSLRPGWTMLAVFPVYFVLMVLTVPMTQPLGLQNYAVPIGMAMLGLAVIISAFVTRRKGTEPPLDENELV